MEPTAMFPLGSVLLPGIPLPLHIFEPRYQRMLEDVLYGSGAFGVVLIERGFEVGGGDSRADVGTLARIEEHRDLGDGHHAVLAVGADRIRVSKWLPDDPYPQAEVTLWPDAPAGESELLDLYGECTAELRRLLATATEMGLEVSRSTVDVPDEPLAGSYLLSALTPVGPFDKQKLLASSGPAQRLELLRELIEDQLALITGDLQP